MFSLYMAKSFFVAFTFRKRFVHRTWRVKARLFCLHLVFTVYNLRQVIDLPVRRYVPIKRNSCTMRMANIYIGITQG
jgi:hypothetical protein